jgi:DNA-binding NarL/FixJ family response regulator
MSEGRAQAPGAAGKVRVLVADDHAVLREGVALLIDREADMCVVGQASGGREALKLAKHLKPDVAVIDLSMPDMNGAQTSEQLLAACPGDRRPGTRTPPTAQDAEWTLALRAEAHGPKIWSGEVARERRLSTPT